MEQYEALLATLALTMGASWASGINLYAALLVLGIGGATGNIELPDALQMLTDPMVIMAAGVMYLVEFFIDKTPGVDTGWDTLHTFVRIPAGAMLAAGAVGDVSPAMEIAAGIMGGSLATVSHATKTGSRALINTSPEPFSNWAASLLEDVAVIAGLWTALAHPLVFLCLLAVFLLLAIWLLPKMWRLIKSIALGIGRFLGIVKETPMPPVTEDQQAPLTTTAADLGGHSQGDTSPTAQTHNHKDKEAEAALTLLQQRGVLTQEQTDTARRELTHPQNHG